MEVLFLEAWDRVVVIPTLMVADRLVLLNPCVLRAGAWGLVVLAVLAAQQVAQLDHSKMEVALVLREVDLLEEEEELEVPMAPVIMVTLLLAVVVIMVLEVQEEQEDQVMVILEGLAPRYLALVLVAAGAVLVAILAVSAEITVVAAAAIVVLVAVMVDRA